MPTFEDIGTTKERINRHLSRAKTNLFFKKNATFLSSIMNQTKFTWNWDIPTARTNGKVIQWNPVFFMAIPAETRITVLAHELWHIAFGHMIRIGDRNPDKWNIAADHVINTMLESEGYSFDGAENCYKDHTYRRMSTEQVYEQLPDDPTSTCSKAGSGAGDPVMAGDLVPAEGTDRVEVIGKIVGAHQAAQQAKAAGSLPGEIILAIDEFLSPKLPWEKLLYNYFSERSNDDYSWQRPNRRFDDPYLPSRISDNGLTTIYYYLDISGSISDEEIRRFNSEVKFIFDEFEPERLLLVTFDTKIHDVFEFTQGDDFNKIDVTGRGGTDLDAVFQHLEEVDEKPSVVVIFSDLYCAPMEDPGIPVLWVASGGAGHTPSYGTLIELELD